MEVQDQAGLVDVCAGLICGALGGGGAGGVRE